MYIGALDAPETMSRLVEQVLCSALDEAFSGQSSNIVVILRSDGSITVEDDGRGMSLETYGTGVATAERLMTTLGACRAERENAAVGKRFCGHGIAIVNALSAQRTLDIRRDGHTWTQEYHAGKALGAFRDTGPATSHGTRISFALDTTIVPKRVDGSDLARRLDALRAEIPETRITLTIEP